MKRTVTFRGEYAEEWCFGDKIRYWNRRSERLVLLRSDLDICTATDLQAALRQVEAKQIGIDQVHVTDLDEQYVDEEGIPLAPVAFELFDGDLTVGFTYVNEAATKEITEDAMAAALQPLLERHRAFVETIARSDYDLGKVQIWELRIGFSTRGRNLSSLFSAGEDTLELMAAFSTGELTRETAGHLVRGGRADVLVGQPEGHWLEAKGQHYDLATAGGQISLAQAVSRFCNSEQGGVVVVGMRTKKTALGDQIRGISPMPVDHRVVRRYQQVLEKRLFPLPDNFQIDAVDSGSGSEIILLDIPPQPEELKPFLVHGVIIDGKEEGAFISIVRRRGDVSVPITAPMIHSTLAAGRALLRRGELPKRTEDEMQHRKQD